MIRFDERLKLEITLGILLTIITILVILITH